MAGGPAPWAMVPPARRQRIGLDRVISAVTGSVTEPLRSGPAEALVAGGPVGIGASPGPAGGSVGAVGASPGPVAGAHPVPTELMAGSQRPAAVLVALFEEAGQARVVLTRRAGHLRSHRHEVSFPGGRLEPGETPEQGACREAAEEVALDPALVTPIGRLSPLVTVSSMNWLVPVVATLPERPRLVPNPTEVARVLDVALAELAADGVFREEQWPIRHLTPTSAASGTYPVWFFELFGETVWGATARVLVELLTKVLIGPAPPPGRG